MIARTYSATLLGVNAVEVEIESSESPGLQFRMSIVGLPDTAVKESRDRVLAAMRSQRLLCPDERHAHRQSRAGRSAQGRARL